MSAPLRSRLLALPIAAVVLVGAVLGVQLTSGGGDFTVLAPADPCRVRSATSTSEGIEGLTERLVVLGLDGAACRLHTTREGLLLQLAQPGDRSDAQLAAVRVGLLQAVDWLDAQGALPPASDLVDEALDRSSLNGFLKAAIRALPDSVIDAALKTDDVLRHTIENLDLRGLLDNLDNPDELNSQISAAVTKAVEQALVDRLRDLI